MRPLLAQRNGLDLVPLLTGSHKLIFEGLSILGPLKANGCRSRPRVEEHERRGIAADPHGYALLRLSELMAPRNRAACALVAVLLGQPPRQHLSHGVLWTKVVAPNVAPFCRADPDATIFVGAFDPKQRSLFGFFDHEPHTRERERGFPRPKPSQPVAIDAGRHPPACPYRRNGCRLSLRRSASR